MTTIARNDAYEIVVASLQEVFAQNGTPAPDNINEAARLTMEDSDPVEDDRGPIDYKRAMVRVLTRRALGRALERAQGGH